MAMDSERWSVIKDAFDRISHLDPDAASRWLADSYAEDADVRDEAMSLLVAHRTSPEFLQAPASWPEVVAALADADPLVGRTVGSYRILRQVSTGGMGAVYHATRSDGQYDQSVAVKVLRAGRHDLTLVDRFRAERRILATLQHPDIAHLIDAGTLDDGRPYFVMEFVDGVPIDVYCARSSSSMRERLALIARVAAAVHHAHQRLVVHRDIKPSNVLVTSDGQPKLVDFGIAKLLDAANLTETPLTLDLLPMTLRYASPEQVRGEPMTTATDVYSLGVLLYELVTGVSPYRAPAVSQVELVKAICEDLPVAPSAAAAGDEASVLTLDRRDLRGDVDTIVLKAIAKEPARRYPSALALADDIERHLGGRPVSARPDSVWYRSTKFVTRHRVGVALAAVALILLVSTLIVALVQSGIASRERARAEARYADVRRIATAIMFDIHDAIADLPGATTARERLLQTALEHLDRLSADAGDDLELTRELAVAYQRLAAIQAMPGQANTGHSKAAVANARKAVALLEHRAVLSGQDPKARLDWALSLANLSYQLVRIDTAEAVAITRQAVSVVETPALAPTEPAERANHASVYYALGSSLVNAGDTDNAVAAFEKNVVLLESLIADHPDRSAPRQALALTSKRLGAILGTRGAVDEAYRHYTRAREIEEAILAADPNAVPARRAVSVTLSDLGWLLRLRKRFDEALAHYEQAREIREELAKADPRNTDMAWMLSSTLLNIGAVHGDRGAFGVAQPHLERSAHIREALLRQDPDDVGIEAGVADIYAALGNNAFAERRYGVAVREHARSLSHARRVSEANPSSGPSAASLAFALGNLGEAQRRMAGPAGCSELAAARKNLHESVAQFRRAEAISPLSSSATASRERTVASATAVDATLGALTREGRCSSP